jgi:hypothetical protein
MNASTKKGIRVDMERVQTIYKLFDEALKKAKIQLSFYELALAEYMLLRNFEMYQRMMKAQHKEVK